jgi:hypothetical protein
MNSRQPGIDRPVRSPTIERRGFRWVRIDKPAIHVHAWAPNLEISLTW